MILGDGASFFNTEDLVKERGGRRFSEDRGSLFGRKYKALIGVFQHRFENGIGLLHGAGVGKSEFGDQAILEDTPLAFDTAFGLRGVCLDDGDTELIHGSAELSQRFLIMQLFENGGFARRMEDGVTVRVQRERKTVRREDIAHKIEIRPEGFGLSEVSPDIASGIVFGADQGEWRASSLKPVMR